MRQCCNFLQFQESREITDTWGSNASNASPRNHEKLWCSLFSLLQHDHKSQNLQGFKWFSRRTGSYRESWGVTGSNTSNDPPEIAKKIASHHLFSTLAWPQVMESVESRVRDLQNNFRGKQLIAYSRLIFIAFLILLTDKLQLVVHEYSHNK
jgi:hypothetical protein